MKKFIAILLISAIVIFCSANIYATNLNNSTVIVNPYNETDTIMDNMFDGLSIGIIVAGIVIIIGVILFFLIPKE